MTDEFYTEFRRLSPKVTGGLVRMREETFRDAAVAGKYKVLTGFYFCIEGAAKEE